MSKGLVDTMRGHTLSRQSAHFVDLINILRKNVSKGSDRKRKKARAVGISSNRKSECLPWECYRCGSEDRMIAKYPKPSKDSEKLRKSVCFHEKGDCACDNNKYDNDYNIYASMPRMSSDDERGIKEYGDSSQLTN